MPKKEWKIERFELGINDGSSEKDIADNELVMANGVDLDTIGIIKNTLKSVAHTGGTSPNTFTSQMNMGNSLFKLSSDYTLYNQDSVDIVIENNDTIAITGVDSTIYSHLENRTGAYITLSGFGNQALNGSVTITSTSNNKIYPNITFAAGMTGASGTLTLGSGASPYYISKPGPAKYICFINGNKKIDFYEQTNNAWNSTPLSLIAETSGLSFTLNPNVYTYDGVIRVSDKNATHDNYIPNWVGWVNRTFWKATANAQGYTSWQALHQAMSPPTGFHINSSYHSGARKSIIDLPGGNIGNSALTMSHKLISVTLVAHRDETALTGTSPTATGWEAKWSLAVSYVYEGEQESPLCYRTTGDDNVDFINSRVCYTDGGSSGNNEIPYIKDVSVELIIRSEYGNSIDPRIKGINVYASEEGADSWWKIASFDTSYGGNDVSGVGDYKAWAVYPDSSHDGRVWSSVGYQKAFPNTETFETSSGYASTATDISAQYRTSTVLGRVVYIGDVTMYNPDKGSVIDQGDVMVKTPPNKPDTFLWENISIATTSDGEKIIHLEGFNDRVLQFKEQTLYIINVAAESEFLEATKQNMGVSHSGAVCKSEFGVSWVNKHGIYHYDGSRVVNLLERKNQRIISESKWESFIGTRTDPLIGYHPYKKWLIIKNNATVTTNSEDGSAFVFSFKTGSFVYNQKSDTNAMMNHEKVTNFIVDWDDNMIFGSQSGSNSPYSINLKKINRNASGNIYFEALSKDLNFNSNSARKRIYNIYVTHRNAGGSNVKLYYKRTDYSSGKDASWQDAGFFTDETEWAVQKFTISKSNTVSLQIKISAPGTGATDKPDDAFEIGDINVVYRENTLK